MKNIPEELIPVIDYWERHGKKTVAVALVALVAGVGYWAWDRARTQTRQEVSDALVQQYMRGMPKHDAESAIEELSDAIGKANDPAVIPLLKLRLAKAQYAAGRYAEAEALYAELKDNAPAGYEDVPAAGLAATLEAAGKIAEARQAYDAFIAASGASVLKLEAQLGSARCLAQSGKKDEAVKAVEKLLAEQEGLESAKADKEAALEKAKAALEPLKTKGFTSKDKEFADAEAAIASCRTELAALELAIKDKPFATMRIKSVLDLVKRWEKRAAEAPAAAADSIAAAVSQLNEKKPEAAPAPAAAPAEKKAE